MTPKTFIPAISAIALLAACGGGSTGGGVDSNGISTTPINGPEVERLFEQVASAADSGGIDPLTALEGDLAGIDLASESPRDLTLPGSASYEGAVILTDLDVSPIFALDDTAIDAAFDDVTEDDLPSFLMLGRSAINVEFGTDPQVSGGANGFIGMNIETFVNTAETIDISPDADISDIINALPTVNVNGALTYSGGEIIVFDPALAVEDNLALGFDVTGNLVLSNALTGNGSRDLTIDGRGLAGFTDSIAIGVVDLTGNGQDLGGFMIGVDGQ